jgi:hypothetical protein
MNHDHNGLLRVQTRHADRTDLGHIEAISTLPAAASSLRLQQLASQLGQLGLEQTQVTICCLCNRSWTSSDAQGQQQVIQV